MESVVVFFTYGISHYVLPSFSSLFYIIFVECFTPYYVPAAQLIHASSNKPEYFPALQE